MAKKPTHYKITVNMPFEHNRARFRPGARYTVTAAFHDSMKADHGAKIASAAAVTKGD
ncbi:hypothetical protein [Aquicoccus sp.]|uniref:hypothetical protein n=1 Tax=Aquicoccus sp. TaxID=2055851 RepID=UPI003566DA7E